MRLFSDCPFFYAIILSNKLNNSNLFTFIPDVISGAIGVLMNLTTNFQARKPPKWRQFFRGIISLMIFRPRLIRWNSPTEYDFVEESHPPYHIKF